MRYLFRTQYRQDIALWRHNGDRFWYGLLAVLVLIAPLVLGEFYIGELGGAVIGVIQVGHVTAGCLWIAAV